MNLELTDHAVVERLVELASEQRGWERRQEPRHPFFRRATIVRESSPGTRLSAFTREVSLGGIGLLHDYPLPQETVRVIVSGESKPLTVEIRWCQSCGDGWFISGGRFA